MHKAYFLVVAWSS